MRTIRGLIYFFLGLIAVFFLLLLINFIGPRIRPLKPEPKRDQSADNSMRSMYSNPSVKQKLPGQGELPAGSAGLAPAAAGGAIMLVKETGFKGVADKPKDPMAALSELGAKKPAPVPLGSDALAKKLNSPSLASTGTKLTDGVMPELGRKENMEGLTLITAPVDYKLFKDKAVWDTFAESRRVKIKHDFSGGDLLILVPVSDFPAGIFKIISVEKGAKETVVKYRVDPMAMSSGSDEEQRSGYAHAAVPRKCPPIRLQQVP